MTGVYGRIRDEGPLPASAVNTDSITSARVKGVKRFRIPSNSPGNTTGIGGHQDPVYYIDAHTPQEIVEVWVENNQTAIEVAGEWSIHHRISRHGEAFKQASYDLFAPFEHLSERENNGGEKGGECSLCGEEYERSLPRHLPCDPD
jgi:hypothetical protein